MSPIQAYELEATVSDGKISVDPRLEGHRVKVIVLDAAPAQDSAPWLERLYSNRTRIAAPIVPLSRDVANERN